MNVGDKLTYTNRTGHKLSVILEPWGEEYCVEPNDSIDIVVHNGSPAGHLEIAQTAEGLIIYGWEGSVVSILHAGLRLMPAQTPAPAPSRSRA
jgi:hypothetical protein